MEKGGVSSSETFNGGEDVFSSKESDASTADHLVMMVHGILGSASDWKFGAEQFVQNLPDKVFVHCEYIFSSISHVFQHFVSVCCVIPFSAPTSYAIAVKQNYSFLHASYVD